MAPRAHPESYFVSYMCPAPKRWNSQSSRRPPSPGRCCRGPGLPCRPSAPASIPSVQLMPVAATMPRMPPRPSPRYPHGKRCSGVSRALRRLHPRPSSFGASVRTSLVHMRRSMRLGVRHSHHLFVRSGGVPWWPQFRPPSLLSESRVPLGDTPHPPWPLLLPRFTLCLLVLRF